MPHPTHIRILTVEDVHLTVLNSDIQTLRITCSGMVGTPGWSHPALSPWFYLVPPTDGIWDFDFVATPPSGFVIQVPQPISIAHQWKNFPVGLKGVRVHAQQNRVETQLTSGNSLNLSLKHFAVHEGFMNIQHAAHAHAQNRPSSTEIINALTLGVAQSTGRDLSDLRDSPNLVLGKKTPTKRGAEMSDSQIGILESSLNYQFIQPRGGTPMANGTLKGATTQKQAAQQVGNSFNPIVQISWS